MILISLPPFVAPLVVVLFALIVGLALVRTRARLNVPDYEDVDERVSDLRLKVQSPLKYRARQARRWMDGRL